MSDQPEKKSVKEESSVEHDLRYTETVYNSASEASAGEALSTTVATSGQRPPTLLLLSLAVLLLLALAVVFVLPGIVDDYELPLERRDSTAVTSTTIATEAASPEAISPFQQAQLAQQRKDAQDVLAQLLSAQTELTELEVLQWAAAEYQAALDVAVQGDEAYRGQEFLTAKSLYQQGFEQLQELLDSSLAIATTYIEAGQQALDQQTAELALENFALALAIDPNDPQALEGYQRAENLDEVLQLMESAGEYTKQGDFEQGKSLYQRVLALDPNYSEAITALQKANTAIKRNEFNSIMSEGFRSLEQRDPEQAIAAFNRALATGFNNNQAQSAIDQTRTELADAKIATLRARILTAEASEEWQNSVDLHNEIAAIDSNLVFTQEGADHAGKRLQLDNLLEGAIANPLRLGEDAIYQQVLDVYYTATNIPSPGPRLQSQIERLYPLLEASQVSEDITIISDGLTDVTLLRVGNLGPFNQQSVTLSPGEYVLVGKRSGYREVRQEFVVGFGLTPADISVICNEAVVVSGRR